MSAPTGITVIENDARESTRVAVPSRGATRGLAYRIVRSLGGADWTVRDPKGGAICRAATHERALLIAEGLAECARGRVVSNGSAC